MVAVEGRVTQKGDAYILILDVQGTEMGLELKKLRDGVYELADHRKLLVNDTRVNIVITDNSQVIAYCYLAARRLVDRNHIGIDGRT